MRASWRPQEEPAPAVMCSPVAEGEDMYPVPAMAPAESDEVIVRVAVTG